jgi:outer membrane protein OmpA-like peptidoglycan-associated protein
MRANRNAVLAAASLLAAIAVAPAIVEADDQQPPPGPGQPNKKYDRQDRGGGGEERRNKPERDIQRWQQGKPQGKQGNPQVQQGNGGQGQQGNRRDRGDRNNNPAFGQQNPQKPDRNRNGNWSGNPNAFQKPQPNAQQPPPPNNAVIQPQQKPLPNSGQPNFNNTAGGQNNEKHRNLDRAQQQPGNDWKRTTPGFKPPSAGNPVPLNSPQQPSFAQQKRQPISPEDAKRRFEALRGQRKEVKFDGGKGVVIEEPGKRRIFRDNNRVFIQHDDTERLRRVAPNARFEKGHGGTNIAVIDRPGGYKIYSETDGNGQLLRRYRRGPDGRDVIIIDNRRRRHDNFGRNVAAGIGIGVGVIAGAAILNSVLDVPPPRVTIPRDEYIVDYERASDEDVYDALSAPPVEDFRDRYTLDEIRATAALRDRMRRIDLDDITFDFGSWEVNPSQYGKLDRIARAMRRVIDRNPNEVFMIEGYTDAVGTPEDNLSLSDRRAESVAEVLSEQFQIPFENLTTQGYGEEFLKVPTQAPERLNRRVAVRRITPLLARDNSPPPPPPPPGSRQPAYDDGPGGPDDGGQYDDRNDDRGGDDRGGYDDRSPPSRGDPRY